MKKVIVRKRMDLLRHDGAAVSYVMRVFDNGRVVVSQIVQRLDGTSSGDPITLDEWNQAVEQHGPAITVWENSEWGDAEKARQEIAKRGEEAVLNA